MEMRSWVTQRGMQAFQTSFHSYSFCFQTVNRDVKNLFNSGIPYIQGWIRNVCRGIFDLWRWKKVRLRLLLTVGKDFATEFNLSIHQTLRFNNFNFFGKLNLKCDCNLINIPSLLAFHFSARFSSLKKIFIS